MENVIVKENIIQKKLYYNKQMLMSYTIKYPTFISEKYSSYMKKLNAIYKTKMFLYQSFSIMKLYKMAIEEYEYSIANGFPVRTYEAIIDYTVTYNQNCALSLYFDKYEYTGGAHGNTIRTSDSWDLEDEKSIKLIDLFPQNILYEEYIFKIVNEQIVNQIDAGNNIYFENYQQLMIENFDKDNFYLTEEGVVIFYQQYDIAPYSSGILTFTIPYSDGIVVPPIC